MRQLGVVVVLVGYARTSTVDQAAGFEAQIRELTAAGCDRIFKEQISSVAERPQLEGAIDFVREEDALVVCKLDRLARSIKDLWTIIDRLKANGVSLRVLNLGIDTGSATGKLILSVLGGIAEFEREMLLERQREGIAKAKAEGKYRGRAPTARRQAAEVIRLKTEGLGATEIARTLSLGRASVYRIINAG